MSNSTILGPKARRAILAKLFLAPDQEFYLRELVRVTGFAPRTIQVEVDYLVADDLIKDRRDGNRRYFRANTDTPFYVPIRDILLRGEGLAAVIREALGTEGIRVAFVFGSVASGTATGSSDVDLLVVGTISLKEIVGRLSGIYDQLGREVNPVVWTEEEYSRRLETEDHFLRRVLGDSRIMIVGDDDELG